MRTLREPIAYGFIILLIVPLAGCTLGAKKQTVVPPPPAPQPTTEPQLSVPQTSVVLPSPQPVNPDAIPPLETAQKPAPEKPEGSSTPARRVARRPATARPEAEPEADTPPAPPPEQPAIQPIMSAEEQRRIQGAIEARRREIADWMTRAKGHPSDHNVSLVERIKSFLTQSEEAEKRGDYAQADALSERAVILAKELQVD